VAPWPWLLLVPIGTVRLVLPATAAPVRFGTRSPAVEALRLE